ncbi:MAG: lipid II flippase MurJ [Tetrasphaera sp.]
MSLGPGVAGNARTIALITAAARVAGFARTIVFAATVGATTVGSIYQSTNTVPNVIFEVAAGGVLAAATVPLLAARVAAADRSGVDAITCALLGWVLVLLVPVAAVVLVAARPIAAALLDDPTLGADAVSRGAFLLAIFAPQIVLYGVGIVLTGVLQAYQRFAAAAAAPLVSSGVVIATYVLYGLLTPDPSRPSRAALLVLAVGTTLGVLALVATLLPSLRATGVSLHPRLRFPDGVARRALDLAGAGLIALLAQQLAVLSVIWLSNHRGGAGVLIAYQYAQAVYLLPYAVLAVPLATAAFPVLAAGVADSDREPATAVLARTLRSVGVVSVAGAAALIAAAPDVGGFFAALDRTRGTARGGALAAVPAALSAMAPALVGFALLALLTRALYARGPARLAAGVAAGGWLIAAGLPVVLTAGRSEVRGTMIALGLAMSVGMTGAAAALAALVRAAWGPSALAGVPRTLGAALAGGAAGVALLRWGLPQLWAVPDDALLPNLLHGALAGLGAAVPALAAVVPATPGVFGGAGDPRAAR